MDKEKETGVVSTATPSAIRAEQAKEFAISIDAVDAEGVYDLTPDIYQGKLAVISRTMGCDYWTILHNRDVDEEGEPKHLHWHLVIKMKRSRRIKNAVIKGVAKALGINKDRVHVLISYDLEADLRYLCHLDDEDKYLYLVDEVITSDEKTWFLACQGSLNQLTMERLESAYELGGGTLIGIMRQIGIRLYRLNAVVIHDYVNERNDYKYAKAKANNDSR